MLLHILSVGKCLVTNWASEMLIGTMSGIAMKSKSASRIEGLPAQYTDVFVMVPPHVLTKRHSIHQCCTAEWAGAFTLRFTLWHPFPQLHVHNRSQGRRVRAKVNTSTWMIQFFNLSPFFTLHGSEQSIASCKSKEGTNVNLSDEQAKHSWL